jgi:phosphate transport system protein
MERTAFDQDLQQVKDDILFLGSMVEEAVLKAARALRENDMVRARQLVAEDAYINAKRFETEGYIIALIAIEQPVAHDLRVLAACLDICTELERMGDYAKGIAIINLRSEGLSMPNLLGEIFFLAERIVDMLHRSLTAFLNENADSARAIILEDDEVDALYRHLYSQAVNRVLLDARDIERINYVIWVAHNLERLADRTTNICERVIYVSTGELPETAIPRESRAT